MRFVIFQTGQKLPDFTNRTLFYPYILSFFQNTCLKTHRRHLT